MIRSPEWGQVNSLADLKEKFGGTAYVYAPYILWRSGQIWNELKTISIPGEIRRTIEQTYSELPDDAPDWVREAYEKLLKDRDSLREHAIAAMSQRMLPLDDNEEILLSTRYGNRREKQVLLLSSYDKSNTTSAFCGTTIDEKEILLRKSDKHINRSQAIAANLNCLRIPEYSLQDTASQWWTQRLVGMDSLGLVLEKDGRLYTPEGEPTVLNYNDELGLYQEKIMVEIEMGAADEFDW